MFEFEEMRLLFKYYICSIFDNPKLNATEIYEKLKNTSCYESDISILEIDSSRLRSHKAIGKNYSKYLYIIQKMAKEDIF